MIVDWTTLMQGFWLGVGFWTATVATFVFFAIAAVIASILLGIFDGLTKRKDGNGK